MSTCSPSWPPRLLDSGDTNKNDPNDARSVAVAATRAKVPADVAKEDHAAVMRLWVRRRKDLASARTRVANQLHAVLLELVPGGYAGEIRTTKAARMLESLQPAGPLPPPARNWPASCWATCATWTTR